MPAAFDEASVARLLQDIDKPYNCSILQVGYFGHRLDHPLPYARGYEMVVQALAKEPIGSQRWFLLQQVRGYAGTYTPAVPPSEAYLAYNAVFDHAKDASTPLAQYSLTQSINEYVATCVSRFYGMGIATSPDTQKTLANAWKAYVITNARKDIARKRFKVANPEWGQAIQMSKSEAVILPVIESSLREATTPRNYIILATAAQVYAASDLARAILLLKQAKPLLQKEDASQVTLYYTNLVQLLVKAGSISEAIEEQKERVALTGRGRGELIRLISQSDKPTSYDAVLTDLSQPSANPWEVNDAAEMLLGLVTLDKKVFTMALSQAEQLLSIRLKSTLNSNRGQDLRSRFLLAQILLSQNRHPEALKILETVAPLSSDNAQEKDYYSRVVRLKNFIIERKVKE